MRRILLVLAVGAVMVAMLATMVGTASAQDDDGGRSGGTEFCVDDVCQERSGGGGFGSGEGGFGGGGTIFATDNACDPATGHCITSGGSGGGCGFGSGVLHCGQGGRSF